MGKIIPDNWTIPNNWLKITTIDAHTEGEPLRIITSGLPELKGDSILDYRRYMKENFDHLRRTLMWEPRGHADQYGCIITPPFSDEADFGVFFLHNEGYSTMCGHAILAVTKVVLQIGMIKKKEPFTTIKIDSPAGLVTSYAKISKGVVEKVYFHNVPSFVYLLNQSIDVAGIGNVNFDIAFGGAFYAFVKAEDADVQMTPGSYSELIEKGSVIKKEIMKQYDILHPYDSDLCFLYGTIFYGEPENKKNDSRNVCIFAEGEVDRSPTGTGVSARMALHYAKGEIGLDEPMIIESILGTTFTAKIKKLTCFDIYDAVIPEVSGTAFITGKNEFYIDPNDPLKDGFILR